MTHAIKKMNTSNQTKEKLGYFFDHHPRVAFLSMMLGMPLSLILVVGLFTTLIMLPVAWLCEWPLLYYVSLYK